MRQTPKIEFSLTGFVIALIAVSMFAGFFGIMYGEMATDLNIVSNSSLELYNQTATITSLTQNIEGNSSIRQDSGLVDIVGQYFGTGYTAIKVSFQSMDLFSSLIDQGSDDVEGFEYFSTFVYLMVFIALIIGIGVTVLVKMRI